VQLDNSCHKRKPNAALCGAVWPLLIWMWERISVGHPRKLPRNGWDFPTDENGDESRFPMITYSWDKVEVYTDLSVGRYKSYTNEIDTLMFDLISSSYPFNSCVTKGLYTL
jgi:hypothetical protein